MTDIVTARVPTEIRRQADRALELIGATQSDLVRAAEDFVIAEGRLPGQPAVEASPGDAHRLGDDEIAELRASIEASTVPIGRDLWPDVGDGEFIARCRERDYASLA